LELFTSAAAIQGIFLALILIKDKNGNRRANTFIAILLVIFSAVIFHSSYISEYFERLSGYYIMMNEPFMLLIGPFIYFYVRELISEKLVFSKKDAVHFLPIILYFVFSLVNKNRTEVFEQGRATIGIGIWLITFTLFIYYINKIVIVSGIHEKKIEDEFSTIGEIGLQWVKKLLIVFLSIMTILILFFFVNVIHGDNKHFRAVISLASALIIYVMGYRGLRQPDIFRIISVRNENVIEKITGEIEAKTYDDLESKEKYKNSSLSDEDIKTIENKITEFMEKERPYLNPDFNMEMLSETLGVNKNYVSQVINSRFGYNFFNFVNYYRVEEVKRRIISPDNDAYTILSVAFDSGFNSKASFNNIFKKFTGLTPSEYKKTVVIQSVSKK
jgi:AraC-like DNA-binding protein